MGLMINLLMMGISLPVGLLIIAVAYPKNWQKKKIFYGIRNREEYEEPEAKKRISAICADARKKAVIITCCFLAIAILLTILHKLPLNLTLCVLNIYVYILMLFVPFSICNRKLKSLKRELGIVQNSGISFTDISNTSTVHAFKPVSLLIPMAVLLAISVFSLLIDMKTVVIEGYKPDGGFTLTIFTGIFFLAGLIMLPVGILIDRQRNEVISEDSAINANYNRALKKCSAGLCVAVTWSIVAIIAGFVAGTIFLKTELFMIVAVGLFMVIEIGAMIIYSMKINRIEEHYRKETSIEVDDDDKWIFGMFYYNKSDRRLNVEKRVGIGATVNMAHPVGKVIGALIIATLIFTMLCMVWLGLLEMTPIKVYTEDGLVICHQLRDEYKIEIADIKSIEIVDDLDSRNATRVAGTSMPGLAKGRFSINGESCRLFINPDAGVCVRIETSDRIYYVSGETYEETMDIYNELN